VRRPEVELVTIRTGAEQGIAMVVERTV